jgi:hypothetical protein
MKRTLTPKTLIHAVRIAANEAANRKAAEQNRVYTRALETVATALEEAKISSRSDGNYYLVRLPNSLLLDKED